MASKRRRQATNKETYERNEPKMNICKPQNQRYAKHYHHSIKILIRDSSTVLVRIFSSELSITSKPFEAVSSTLFDSEHRIERFVVLDAFTVDLLKHADHCNVDCDAERPINRNQTDESVVVDDHRQVCRIDDPLLSVIPLLAAHRPDNSMETLVRIRSSTSEGLTKRFIAAQFFVSGLDRSTHSRRQRMTILLVIEIKVESTMTRITIVVHRLVITARHMIPCSPGSLLHLLEIVVVIPYYFAEVDLQAIDLRIV